jgi:outer membrane protein
MSAPGITDSTLEGMVRWLVFLSSLPLAAEVHPLTLRQAVETALRQNPDIALARIDEQAAQQAVRLARDPFMPKVVVGSGLAKTYGFPMSISGAAPSIVQAQANQFLFNRQQSYLVAQAKENVRGAAIGALAKRDEVAWRVASLFLDAERTGRVGGLAARELESLEKVEASIQAAVAEGRELPISSKRAALSVAKARQAIETLQSDRAAAETALAIALGLGPDDRVRPVGEDRPAPVTPAAEEDALQSALAACKELRHLESRIAVKELQIRSEKASRYPRIDLVAQYGLFARFNNFEDYFRRFERHNGQFGASFQLPLSAGPGIGAAVAQHQLEISRMRVEFHSRRNRIATDLRGAYAEIRKAESAREVASLDLEVAREQLGINLALMQEGRLTLRQVEESRVAETDRWIAFYDAQYGVERARLALARVTGDLVGQIQRLPAARP